MERRSKRIWIISGLLALMSLTAAYSYVQVQMGNSPYPPRSIPSAIESFLIIALAGVTSVLTFANHRYAVVGFAILAIQRLLIVVAPLFTSSPFHVSSFHAGLFLFYVVSGVCVYQSQKSKVHESA